MSTRTSGEGSADWVPLRQVSPHLRAAVLAAEDSAFASHNGIDPQNIRDAMADNQASGEIVRGGSTLTQQLAKNLFLDGERTMERKLREALLAVELDRELGKDRVLELYVNIVEWGPDVWGIGPASDLYFLRDASQLPPNEAAFLAALLPSPKRYYKSWYLGGRERRGTVQRILDNMYYGGALSKDDAKRWGKAPLRPIPPPGD
jgi:monofunctional biosynthetic peptidoglycan transglycosylase